jgi:dipeptidyl aminopeptidase/acylaminoacyl peptidase
MRRLVLPSLVLVAAACGGPGAVAPQPCPSGGATASATAPLASTSASATVPPAPQATSSYDKPPPAVLEALHTPSPPRPSLSPTREDLILVTWVDYPSIARVAEPYLKLAGIRVEPRNHSNHSTSGGYGIAPCATSYVLVHVQDGAEKKVALPEGACADRLSWSADGKRFTFRETTRDAVELWIGETATGAVHRIDGVRINPMLGSAVQWMPDQKTLLVKRVPNDQGPPPPAPPVPPGPNVQETKGEGGQSSTYEARDVLRTAHDEALFDYYATSELVFVDVTTGQVTPFKKPGLYADVDAAPGGNHVLVETIHRPYSHVVTADRFPRKVEVLDRTGATAFAVADLPLADRVPVHGVPTGPRDYSWRPTDPATLVWAEALDGGDWNKTVPNRDKVMVARAPFTAPPLELLKTEQRYGGFTWGERPSFALLGDHDENKHWEKTWIVDVDAAGGAKKTLLWDMSTDEHYKDPGNPVTKVLPNGSWVIRQEGDAIFLSGDGASPDGDRPFLDRYDVAKKTTDRLFRSDKTALEYFYAFDPSGTQTLLTWHQSPTDPPNVHRRTLGAKVATPTAGEPAYASTVTAITHLPDPIPAVRAIKKRLVKYKRKDGLDLKFTLYTPPGYQEGTKVPTILYAYPLDYADAAKAGQVTGSQQTFTRLRDHMLLLLAGYAIIEDASFPIVGDPKKAYDTYLDQLVMDAKAAVDQAVAIGVADPQRIGVTGHSHGALMTANLLAHSNLFRAGIATSGSYNKTLTAFGFQNERRSVWQAPDVYLKVSPFFAADKIKAPILIVHGEDDANPGTTPLQAEKLYEAVRGNGGVARLVMLPYEPHWYSAMESNEQLLYEEVRWFDMYVKNAPPAKP